MKNEVSERLLEFIRYLEVSVRSFERNIGVANGFAKAATSGMGVDKIRRINEIYPTLNTDWLLTGEGEMLKKSEAARNVYTVEQNNNADIVNEGGKIDKRVTINGEPSDTRLEVERLRVEVSVLREQNERLWKIIAGKGQS